jgi:hypothetical protein
MYGEEEMIEGLRMARKERPISDPEFPRSTAFRHAVRWTTEGDASAFPAAAPLGSIEADTGQIGWYDADAGNGVVTIDTPRTQALIGFVRDGRRLTSHMAGHVDNEFCCLYLTSLGDKTIRESDRLLLATTARATLTGFAWNPGRKTIKSWGRAPTVIEPVTGAVTLLRLCNSQEVSVTPLAAEGRPLTEPGQAKITNLGWRVAIGEPATTSYLIEVRRSSTPNN